MAELIVLEFCGEPLALTREQWDEARIRARALLPKPETAIAPSPDRLVDSKDLAVLTSLPKSWIEEQARRETIPSLRCGKYVRFQVDDALAAIRKLGRTP